MKLSYDWLKEYINLKKLTPEEIAGELSLRTVEVEGLGKEAEKFDRVVVGKILEVRKHPNADRLQLAKVEVGGGLRLDIVCGAPNIAPGQLVPVALVGAKLPDGLEIKEAEVRGEKSQGMLCAPDELGLGDDHSGILILGKKAKIGQPLAQYLRLEDVIFEIDNKSLSNRPDLWGHYGMARELSAIFNLKLKPLDKVVAKPLAEQTAKAEKALELEAEVKETTLCPRYMAVAMSGIRVDESPEWLRKRLVAAGMRPINNIVDVTNFVMLELGQPMHAFDASKLKNKGERFKIIIRRAKAGETLESLDGQTRKLSEEMLVIADEDKALAVAGVMGGAESEIGAETSTIILEAANFNPVSVRKTSSRLALRTESSMRFEKSLDPTLCEPALARAVELIRETNPQAKVASQAADEKNFRIDQGPVELDLDWIAKKIGEKLPTREIVRILEHLGFAAAHVGHKLSVTIPTWRATKDVATGEDIVEEIVRIYGYDRLAALMPEVRLAPPEANLERGLERRVKELLSGAPALAETYNYSFVGEDQLKHLNIDPASYLRLVNPIASNQNLLRQNLTPNLLNNVRINQARFDAFGLFEIGNIFLPVPGEIEKGIDRETLPYQEKHLGIVLAGDAADELFGKAKGIVEYLSASLYLPAVFKEAEAKPLWADASLCAAVFLGDRELGLVAKVDGQAARRLGLKKEAVAVELSFKTLVQLARGLEARYAPVEKYPSAVRDLAFVIDARILYNDINREISGFDPLIKKVELFDVYEGEKLGRDKRSLAFHITYQGEKTLTAEEVDQVQQRLIRDLEEKFGAKVRDF